jgi:nitroimidazol reductase NimA-like FMN-containing flavoprotein (pyridoxamine 5'-phosphate oxidase superfamily)
MPPPYEPTPRTRLRLRPDRGSYDRQTVHAIIDEALVAHVGFVANGHPRVIPTAIVRVGEAVYIHGSRNNFLLNSLEHGSPACITITLVDSIVAGRSGFGCSMDYRSVMIFSSAEVIIDDVRKKELIDALVQDIIPGHIVRKPKPRELAATLFLRFPIDEVSAKIRDVGVLDVDGDYELDLWAGRIPLSLVAGEPESCPRVPLGVRTPEYAKKYSRQRVKKTK